MILFSVRDLKAQHFLKPVAENSVAQAVRSFEVTVNEPGSILSRFPDDFDLVQLGTFDVSTGTIVSNLQSLGTARSFVKEAPTQSVLPLLKQN